MARTAAVIAALIVIAAGGGQALAAPGSPSSNVEIDRVEVTGVSVFPTQDVEAALEIGPGEKLERVRVVRTAENLQALYRVRGYDQMSIRSKITRSGTQNVLEFSIIEGKPTRIAAIRFNPESIREESFQKYWARIEEDLVARIGLSPGDIFDQEKVSAGKRQVQELLVSEEFIGARVDDVRVSRATAPAGDEHSELLAAVGENVHRWVVLEFRVDLGDRVSFGFRGNTMFSTGRLMSLVEEQRTLGFGKDYIGAIRGRIEEEYRAVGFQGVEIIPYTSERPSTQERHVTFSIQEGARVGIASLVFDGNAVFSTSQLMEQFFKRSSAVVEHRYYSEKDVQRSAELVVEWIKSQGYLSAKLVSINTSPVSRARARNYGKALNLTIYLHEGDQTLVETINVQGAQAYSEEEILRILGVREGQPLNLFAFSEGIESLKARYRSRGYLNMQITNEGSDQVVRYSDENRLAAINLELAEGPRFKVGKVEIEGLTQTREEIVRREILLKEGQYLEEAQLLESEASIRRLGIFSLVSFRLHDDPQRPDHKLIRVVLQEGTPGIIAGGVGFRSDLGIRLFGQTAYTNIGGRNHTVSLNAAMNRRFEEFRFTEYYAQIGYMWPWFMLGETTFRPAIAVGATQYLLFDANTLSGSLTLERPLARNPNFTALFNYTLERIEQFNARSEVDNQTLTIGSITPTLRLDMRDNPLAPTSGLYSAASFEVASPYLASQLEPFPVGYTRFQFRSDYHLPFSLQTSLYMSFRLGFERNTQEITLLDDGRVDPRSGAIPISKQFALGGAGSIRGFREQELNSFTSIIRGTMSYVNYRTQLDLPLAGALRFSPFLDAGNLQVDLFSLGNLRWGAGFGLRYITPVGPINLDWGFKLFPRENEDPYRIYFSVGVI